MTCNYESFIVRPGLCIRKVNRIISASMLPLMSKAYKSETLKRAYHKLTTMALIFFPTSNNIEMGIMRFAGQWCVDVWWFGVTEMLSTHLRCRVMLRELSEFRCEVHSGKRRAF